MSEGERVVFEVVFRDFIDHGEHYLVGDQVWWHKGERCPSPGVKILRRIPDPVPALQARIVELEGELARLKIFAGRAVRSGHLPGCSCYECETVRVMCPAEGQYDSQGKWKWHTPTPAAAKEQ